MIVGHNKPYAIYFDQIEQSWCFRIEESRQIHCSFATPQCAQEIAESLIPPEPPQRIEVWWEVPMHPEIEKAALEMSYDLGIDDGELTEWALALLYRTLKE